MQTHKKKIGFWLICITISLLLTSCYRSEVDQASDYKSFYKDMQRKGFSVRKFLPDLSDEDCIKELYLYYSDEPIKPSYAIYLNCVYSEEEYKREAERMTSYQEHMYRDMESFDYEAIWYSNHFSMRAVARGVDGDGIVRMGGSIQYSYVLLDEEESRIVYITIYEQELYAESVNIPEEFLPAELLELREEYEGRLKDGSSEIIQ